MNVYRLPSNDGIVIKVKPPAQPDGPVVRTHAPCSIVLVIDVSGSMQADALVPDEKDKPEERNGLTVLDLVKHAAHTILETLDKHDRLGIVAFSEDSRVLLMLTPMTPANKAKAQRIIEQLEPLSVTNLWKGLTAAIELFSPESGSTCVPSIMLLTDGLPNYMQVVLVLKGGIVCAIPL